MLSHEKTRDNKSHGIDFFKLTEEVKRLKEGGIPVKTCITIQTCR